MTEHPAWPADNVAGKNAPITTPRFLLHSAESSLLASGCLERLPAGETSTLAGRVRQFFASPRSGPSLLVGALPFDHSRADFLYQPAAVDHSAVVHGPAPAPPAGLQVTAEPSPEAFMAAVARALSVLRAERRMPEGLRKLVLSRSLTVQGTSPIDAWGVARRLAADPSVVTFLVPLPCSPQHPRVLVGATPELLVARRGTRVISRPLAGSLRRHADAARDRDASRLLLRSAKDLDEHRVVVEAILDALSPLCRKLRAPESPALHSTATMWHLGSKIEGELRDTQTGSAELAARLHPTPAICGLPQQRASALISELETCDRGFYTGAVGWTDASGDGDWHVAIRCAEIAGSGLRLFAGAGIVADSNPRAELEETSAKFAALLRALGITEQGAPVQADP